MGDLCIVCLGKAFYYVWVRFIKISFAIEFLGEL
jgi:hypothetical protein